MQTVKNSEQTLEQQINETLKELRNKQTEELELLQKNHVTYMKKLEKLHEYTKIADMTNQLFEKRLLGIENAIKQINKKIVYKE